MVDSSPTDLRCPVCDRTYDAGPDEPWRCRCGEPLTFEHWPVPDGGAPPDSKLDDRRGLWSFFEFLPVSQQVTLGEGFTPIVHAPEWNAQFKLEYVFPTGSFKDRGAATTLSRAVELGVDTVLEDSSGNAGTSIATYAARAGLDAAVYVPGDAAQSRLVAIQRTGARPIRVDGTRDDVARACVEAVADGAGWYASHAWNPAFLAGTATFALELAAQRDWSVPDAVVLPVGTGTLLLGAYRGFTALERAGIVDDCPRLLAAQASGYAPVVEDLGRAPTDGSETDGESRWGLSTVGSTGDGDDSSSDGIGASLDGGRETRPGNEIADGIHIRAAPRHAELLDAIEATAGDAIAVGEDRVELALDRLHRSGFYVEPTAAVGPAALQRFRDEGVVDPDDDVVVPLTGSGANTM